MLGVIYAMVAVGFTLFFGVLDVIKFSHGDVLTAGAFAGLATYGGLQALGLASPAVQLLIIVLVAVAAMAFLGALIAKYLVLPLRGAPPLNILLLTLMLGAALRESVRLFYPQGANPKPFPRLLPQDAVALGSFTLRLDNVLLLLGGLAAIAAVHFVITRTKLGLAIRAVAQDAETARIMGIDFERVVLLTFALGSGLAALAGIMNCLYYSEINFSIGLLLGVIGFSAAVVGPGQYLRRDPRRLPVRRAADGRRGAPAGAAAAGAFRVQGRFRVRGGDRIHGVAADRPDRREDRGARMSVLPGIASIAAMALYAAFFLHAESQAQVLGLVALGVVGVPVLARVGWIARTATSLEAHPLAARSASVAALAVIIALFHDQHFVMLMLASVLLYSVACLGLTVQFGYAGVVNFAGAAFLGVGGYTSAVLGPHVPHALVLLIGGGLAALVGSILILPILRTRGHYAALITVAFGILFRTFVEVNDALGGPQGLQVKGMNLFGWELNSPLRDLSFYANYVFVGLALAAAAFVLVRRLERSWVGLSLDAVRLDETAAAVFGIDVASWKILAFTCGNFFAGIAGAAYAMMTGFVAPNSFTFGDSLILVSIVLLGGLGSAWGVPLAAGIVLIVPEKLQALQEYRFLLYAMLVIVILLARPQGLIARPAREYFPK